MAIAKTDPRGLHPHKDVRSEVQTFLDGLARALIEGNGDAVATMYEVPAFIISNDGVHLVQRPEEIAQFFGSAKAEYNALGVFDTRADLIDLERIGPKIVVATVRWPHLDASHKEIAAEESDYTLRRDDAGKLRIRSVLMRGMVTPPK